MWFRQRLVNVALTRPNILDAFLTADAMCWWNFSSLKIVDSQILIRKVSSCQDSAFHLVFQLCIVVTHDEVPCISLHWIQVASLRNIWIVGWGLLASGREHLEKINRWNSLVSSANIFAVLRTNSGRSLIKMTNWISPKTLPWGIPPSTVIQSDSFHWQPLFVSDLTRSAQSTYTAFRLCRKQLQHVTGNCSIFSKNRFV